jgi:hypothetical protein
VNEQPDEYGPDYVKAWQQLVHTRTHTFTSSELTRKIGAIEHLLKVWPAAELVNADVGRLIICLLLAKPRRNHIWLSQAERDAFNRAVKSAHDDGSYTNLMKTLGYAHDDPVSIKSDLTYVSWSRAYLYQVEKLLQNYEPDLRIPYWDFCRSHTLPAWVYLPDGLLSKRGPLPWTPPQIADENEALTQTTLRDFAEKYYFLQINAVVWSFDPDRSTGQNGDFGELDPVRLLILANIDRIWDAWQRATNYTLNTPVAPGVALSPMTETVGDVRNTYYLYYFYELLPDLELPPQQRPPIEIFPQLSIDPQWFIER